MEVRGVSSISTVDRILKLPRATALMDSAWYFMTNVQLFATPYAFLKSGECLHSSLVYLPFRVLPMGGYIVNDMSHML